MITKIKAFFRLVFRKLVLIDDSPHKIAGGLALGVFLGILPGAGPMASLVLAFVFHLNKAAAFTGSLLTNTWFSVVTFVAAVKIGARVTGTDWRETYRQCKTILSHPHWKDFSDAGVFNIVKPVLIGYAAVGLISGVAAYIIGMIVLLKYRSIKGKARRKQNPTA